MQKTLVIKAVASRVFLASSTSVRFAHAESGVIPPNVILTGVCKEKLLNPILPETPSQHPDECTAIARMCNNNVQFPKSAVKKWVDNFSSVKPTFDEVACLNPRLFDVHPKMDHLHQVVKWQKTYREVDYAWTRTRAEIGKGKKKPWPQKGTGRKRQGSTNSPLWKGGGIAHGPRGPQSLFYKLSDEILLSGITSALTIKSLQNDLIIASPMECLPEKDFFLKMLANRGIESNSILFIHNDNESPQALGDAIEYSKTHSMMPLCALNVYSILKHDKLVLSMDILDELEDKLIFQFERYDWHVKPHNFYKDLPGHKYGDRDSLIGAS